VDQIARRRRENFGDLELCFLAILVFLELQNLSKFIKITKILRDFLKILSFALKKRFCLKKKDSGDTPHPWGGVRVKQLYPWPGKSIF